MANTLHHIGRLNEALTLKELFIKLTLGEDDAIELCVGLQNYSISIINNNQLALSKRTIEFALALAQAIHNRYEIKIARLLLLKVYDYTGQRQLAEKLFQLLQANPMPFKGLKQEPNEQYYDEMLILHTTDTDDAINKSESIALQRRNALDLRELKRWRGELALRSEDYDIAISNFEEALKDARKQGSVEVTTYLACLARAYVSVDVQKAQQYAEEALAQTYKIRVHDMYSLLAEMYLILDDKKPAKEYAIKAYKDAWADGEPYAWWWGLKRSKAVLDALGEPYPDMPPFDESKIGKIPYEDEIREYIRSKGGDA